MALVKSGYTLTVNLVDNGGNRTSQTFELSNPIYDDGSGGGALVDAQDVVTKLEAVTGLEILGYSLNENWIESTVALPASAEYQAEVSASISVYIAGEGMKKGNIRIPCPQTTLWQASTGAGRNRLKLDELAVTDYVGLFTAPATVFISDGETAGEVIDGIRVTRKRRSG